MESVSTRAVDSTCDSPNESHSIDEPNVSHVNGQVASETSANSDDEVHSSLKSEENESSDEYLPEENDDDNDESSSTKDDLEEDDDYRDGDYGANSDRSLPQQRRMWSKSSYAQSQNTQYSDDDDDDADYFGTQKTKKLQTSKRKEQQGTQGKLFQSNLPTRFSDRRRAVTDYNEERQHDEDSSPSESIEKLSSMDEEESATSEVLIPENEFKDSIEKVVDYRLIRRMNNRSGKDAQDTEYLIKWYAFSHLHNSWHGFDELKNLTGAKKVLNYMHALEEESTARQSLSREDIEQLDVEREIQRELLTKYKEVERVVAMRDRKINGSGTAGEVSTQYLCKWSCLPYSECTWEDAPVLAEKPEAQLQIDLFLERAQSILLPHRSISFLTAPRPQFHRLQSQPDYLGASSRSLRDYQLDGLNWLIRAWSRRENCILADEMGLGKTVQAVSFLSYLFHSQYLYGPFLVVAPLSTIASWYTEFERWTTDMNCVVYTGDARSRRIVQAFEFYVDSGSGFGQGSRTSATSGIDAGTFNDASRQIKFNVLLTTYELILRDCDLFGNIRWAHLVVDEAHRLKNSASRLHDTLKDFRTGGRLLITGTPLQNTVQELWSLLNFIMPRKFCSSEAFEMAYGQLDQAEHVRRLHEELKPHLLRRLKKDVEKSLPAKTERILRVELTPVQKQYYRWILSRNYRALSQELKGGLGRLLNIVMELKKCCNHPILLGEQSLENIDGKTSANFSSSGQSGQALLVSLVNASGKMILLDRLLIRLKETGHRVLIFSQMVRMLDVLADYLRLRNFTFERLDGSIGAEQRKQAIDRFNAPGSNDFAFLLSTRAGGLGINLETADTVIIP